MKGDAPNPGEEFFYKLSLRPDFNQFLIDFRKKVGIPKNGLGRAGKWEEKWDRLISKSNIAFHILVSAEHVQTRYKIPKAYAQFIRFYICFGYIPDEFNKSDIARICPPVHILSPGNIDEEQELRSYFSYEPYAKILIFESGSKSDVLKFIKENWSAVEKIIEKQRGFSRKRVRKTIYKYRGQVVKKLWRKPLKELQRKAKTDETTIMTNERDLLVAKILVKLGLAKKELSGGCIRRIANEK